MNRLVALQTGATQAVAGRLLALALVALILCPSAIHAQDVADTRLGISYESSSFRGAGGLSPWHEIQLQASQRTDHGSIYGRVNLADRFGRQAAQVELDAYPSLGTGRYAFVNVGVAGDEVYPSFRASLEIWQGLPGPFEASLGARYLRFSRDVVLYTGSIGYYRGNYWFSARPWVRERNGNFSVSTHFNARKYGADRDDYVGVTGGIGSGIGDLDTADELDRLRSYRVGLETRKPLSDRWFIRGNTALDWEELPFDRTRTRFKFSLGFERGF